MTKKLLCFVFLTVSIFANAQNRYDTPANATFINTYVPMTHEEMMLRAAAEVYKEKQAREAFDNYSRAAYEYLQKKQIGYFTSYANAALSTGYYNSQLYYNLGISYYLSGQKRQGKKFLKKALKKVVWNLIRIRIIWLAGIRMRQVMKQQKDYLKKTYM